MYGKKLYLELDFLRSKAVAAATELSEVLQISQGCHIKDARLRVVEKRKDEKDSWISLTEAGTILGLNPGSISRLVKKGLVTDNGEHGHK